MLQTVDRKPRIPVLVIQLGYAGLIPFMTLACVLWITPEIYAEKIHQALLSYAAIILSFMGAVHWGLAIDNKDHSINGFQLVVSVIPALIAWFSSMTAPLWNYSILIFTFVLLCFIDTYFVQKQSAPEWYLQLRIPLTVVVVISLIIAQFSLL
jgi:hypothetical protein